MQLVSAPHHQRCVHGEVDGVPFAQPKGHDHVHQLPFDEGRPSPCGESLGVGMHLRYGMLALVTKAAIGQELRHARQPVHGGLAQGLDGVLPVLLLHFRGNSAAHGMVARIPTALMISVMGIF